MKVDASSVTVVNNTGANRFEIRIGELVCVLEYELRGETLYFTHTGVPPALEGQGLAGRLAQTGLDYARGHSFKVVPACEFMNVYLRRHPEYGDMVKKF